MTFTFGTIPVITVEVPSLGIIQSLSVTIDYTRNKRFQGQETRQQGIQRLIRR
jgi:hypothetical protein